eukprot:scaffold1211_cov169-Amphora_coffeaeformis.AAC.18
MATMKQKPLQTLDTEEVKVYLADDEAMETDSTDANNIHDKATPAPGPQGKQEILSMSKEVLEEQLNTPRKSFQSSRSLSLDSLVAGTMASEKGSAVLSDGDPNCRGIGSVSVLGGQLLSPILRSSEFGLKRNEHDADESENARLVAVPSQMQPTSPEDTNDKSPDKTNAASQCQEAEVHDNSQEEENGSKRRSSTGSTKEDDIFLAQKQAGASAQAFIQGLRGAAHRRKMNLTRSRDSLAAKEKERKEEAERMAIQKTSNLEIDQQEKVEKRSSQHEFRARALPRSTRMGGVAGLPKIVKRPVTTPFSPLLGARRASMPAEIQSIENIQQQNRPGGVAGLPKADKKPVTTPFSPKLGARRTSMVAVQEKSTHQRTENTNTAPFRARPIPKTVVEVGGQSGVPKVSKRPTTVPSSPLLGPRRPKADGRRHSMMVARQSDSTLTASDSTPLGLEFVDDSENQENRPAHRPAVDDVLVPQFKEFQLQSSIRAQKRAAFDEIRKLRWEARQQEELDQRRERIRRLERELGELRWEL